MNDFVPERIKIGAEPALEYGIYHAGRGQWVAFVDGQTTFVDEPVPLSVSFPTAREAGSEGFAHRVLDWLRKNAGTGIIEKGVCCTLFPHQVAGCAVFTFEAMRPVYLDTPISMRPLKAKDVLFEVQGPPESVHEWVDEYLRTYPKERFATKVTDQRYAPPGLQRKRIWRKRIDAKDLPWGSVVT